MNRLALILLLAVPATFAQDGWISLFNGKDFTGWKVGGDQNTFQIKDGALVANGQVAHAFYDGPVNNHDFKNFHLKAVVLTKPHANSGIYFHTKFQDKGFPSQGFEAQVNEMATQDAALREALRANEEELKGLRSAVQEMQEKRSQIEIDLVRKQAELKYLDETSRKELGCPVEDLSAADDPIPDSDAIAEAEQSANETRQTAQTLA